MPFEPDQSGNPLGRPKGSCNKTRRVVPEWATGIVEDPQVQTRLLADARTGKLHPSVLNGVDDLRLWASELSGRAGTGDAHHHRVEHSQATGCDAYGLDGLNTHLAI